MAKIIDYTDSERRIIKLSTADVMSVVREYQNYVKRGFGSVQTKDALENVVIYIPEDI